MPYSVSMPYSLAIDSCYKGRANCIRVAVLEAPRSRSSARTTGKQLDYVAPYGVGLPFRLDRLDRGDVLRLIVQQLQPVFQRVALRKDLVLLELYANGFLHVVERKPLVVGLARDAAL